MQQAHRLICPVQDKMVRIDLPPDFPDTGKVEVIILPLTPAAAEDSDVATQEWLRDVWACAPNFPDCRIEDWEKK
jgi:hypothetical protein